MGARSRIVSILVTAALCLPVAGCSSSDVATTVGTAPPTLPTTMPSPSGVDEPAKVALTEQQIATALLGPDDIPGSKRWRIDKENESASPSASSSWQASRPECEEVLNALENEVDTDSSTAKGSVSLASGRDFEQVSIREEIASYQDGPPIAELDRFIDLIGNCDKFTSVQDGVTSTFEVFPLAVPNFGDKTYAMRLQISASFLIVIAEWVQIVVGDNVVSLTATGIGGLDSELVPETASIAVAKLNAAATGTPWTVPTSSPSATQEGGSTSSLRPAEEAREDDNIQGKIKESIRIGDLEILVSEITLAEGSGTQGDGRRVGVKLTVSNFGSEPSFIPEIVLVCRGVEGEGGYYVDSTISPYEELPAGSFDEGLVILGQPEDVPTAGCPEPRVRIEVSSSESATIDVPVPAGILD